ncbi:MAG: extracellular solute-binding protein [Pseudomonadota bacterium]
MTLNVRALAAGAAFTAISTIGAATSAFAQSGDLVIISGDLNAAPKAAFEKVVADFKAEYPDINVTHTANDREAHKTAIRNFLSANPPDVTEWYAGNRMAPFVNAGLFEDITDVWDENGLNESFASTAASMTIDGKKWGVPYSYYQWGVYYREDIFADLGLEVPTTWEEFLAVCAALKEAGIAPITIGTKFLWTAAGWFDYLNLRTNGYEHHMKLTAGEIPYTDPTVQATFDRWNDLVEPGYFIANHATYSWQEALPFLVRGEAAMYLMGNFAVAPLKEAGLTDETLGFFQFPEITPGIPKAEDAPTDTFHIPSGAKNKENAKLFLSFLARADVLTEKNKALGQLPPNKNSEVADDKFLKQGMEMLSNAYALAQFYDRDAPAEMAKAGMEGFQRFMLRPGDREKVLENLEKARQRIYK